MTAPPPRGRAVYSRALPGTGLRGRNALPLAGSRTVWWDAAMAHAPGQPTEERPASELSARVRERLSRRRPDLCGVSLDRPRVMGILNVTPDSFSDGGDLPSVPQAVARAAAMVEAGADFLDIGGESTRPGAEEVPAEAEIARTAPVIAAIRAAGIATPISIDTRKAAVAEAALAAGASLVNDVSGLTFDPALGPLVAAREVPVIVMHSVATPATMQDDPVYENVVFDVFDALDARIAAARAMGIPETRIVVDPGIGFGKTLQHNVSLLRHLALYHDLGCALLLGASRKRFIGTLGGAEAPKARLAGSLAVALHAARQGAQLLRVHDVAETVQALRLEAALYEDEGENA